MSDAMPTKKSKPKPKAKAPAKTSTKPVVFKQGDYKCTKCNTIVHIFVPMNCPPAHYHTASKTHHMMEKTK